MHETLDDATLKQYLADDPPTIVNLAIKPHFEALNDKEKKYAHYISKACFAGTRVNLRQVSPESEAIFDFISTLHKHCAGKYSACTAYLMIDTSLKPSTLHHRLVSIKDRP